MSTKYCALRYKVYDVLHRLLLKKSHKNKKIIKRQKNSKNLNFFFVKVSYYISNHVLKRKMYNHKM